MTDAKDPREVAKKYMEANKIKEMFEELGTLLLHYRPSDPKEFLVQQLTLMQHAKIKSTPNEFFSPRDIDTMFSMFDVTGKGTITIEQYKQALRSLGIEKSSLIIPDTIKSIDKGKFLQSIFVPHRIPIPLHCLNMKGGAVVDRKVAFHVKKYLSECQERGAHPSEDTVTYHLTETYAEYKRKPQGPFKKTVASAIKKFYSSLENTYNLNHSSDDDEKISQELEKLTPIASKNMLNQALQNNYSNLASAITTPDPNPPQDSSSTKRKLKRKIKSISHEKPSKAMKSESSVFLVERPTTRYSDVGGIEAILQDVRELIEYPLVHPEVYEHLGVEPPRGILLHGPPGTGKTKLANAIAGECGASFLRISAPEIVSGMSGESEEKLRSLFEEAKANAPAIIFIDEIDAITPKRETSQRGMEKRIVAQLLTSTDSLSLENTNGKPVVIIGATNRPDALDSALRRAGRFDREICLGIPDEQSRIKILKVLSSKMKLSGDFDFGVIARKTPGFVGADLASLTKEAAVLSINRIFKCMKDSPNTSHEMMVVDEENEIPKVSQTVANHPSPYTPKELECLSITMDDFLGAIPKVQPSSKREGFATIPDVSWNDVGALHDVREQLELSILQPIQNPERFEALGIKVPAGVLLYGPPGCGKTLLAKAIANESGANFISIKGPELLDKYVGESERAVRQVFQRARASSPCIVFFDELDALCPKRGNSDGNGVSERVVNQLLTEMDGSDSRRNVFVVAATNRPDIIDPAMLRPGRLDKLVYVPLPSREERASILRAVGRTVSLDPNLDIEMISSDSRCDGFSGADISALVREAGIVALKITSKDISSGLCISMQHFEEAFKNVMPSVSRSDQKMYEKLRHGIRKSRVSIPNKSEDSSKNNDTPTE